jgi:hypothetical protein
MKRSTWILIVVLLLLAATTYLVLQRPGESSSPASAGEMLVSYDSAAVDKLEITSAGAAVVLALEEGKWMIVSPVHYRADDAAVTAAVSRGRRLELKGLVSSNPQKQSLFQVDTTGTQVRVFARGAETASFHIGKVGTSFSETYVRREGSNDVYIAEGPLSYIFVKSPKDWRDRVIFKADRDKIVNIAYRYGDTTFTLAFRDSVWEVDNEPASASVVQSLLGSLSNFLTNEFVDSGYTPTSAPSAIVELLGTQIRFYQPKNSTKLMVQSSQSPQWYEVENWRASEVLKRKKDLQSH